MNIEFLSLNSFARKFMFLWFHSKWILKKAGMCANSRDRHAGCLQYVYRHFLSRH